MTSTGSEPAWQWPEDLPGVGSADAHTTEHVFQPQQEPEQDFRHRRPHEYSHQETTQSTGTTSDDARDDTASPPPPPPKTYPSRTCRICLDVVHPTLSTPSENIPGMFQSAPTVTYESEEGRLIRPCLCKGSQKYVHEGCLTAWRLQDPMEKRNYWQCPTCKYSYRLERMTWARFISSTASQIALTLAIFFVVTFLLGFFADPIINLYLDPYNTIADLPVHGTQAIYDDEPDSWAEHFTKGMASLGLLGFAKFVVTLNPWALWNMRGGGGARAGANGRDRVQQISWIAVLVGIATVLVALWKGVRAWSRKTLEHFSESVMDVPGGDDDDDE